MPPVRLRGDNLTNLVSELIVRVSGRVWQIRAGHPLHSALPADRPSDHLFDRPTDHSSDLVGPQDGGGAAGGTLYVSATPESVRTVFTRAITILARRRVPFSFASTVERVRWLGQPDCPKDDFGRCLAVHPRDDAEFADLAEDLHLTTAGLAGPRIPGARPVRPRSLVAVSVTADGTGARGGSGESTDSRHHGIDGGIDGGIGIGQRLGARYVVHRTLRFDPTGGAYLATDERPTAGRSTVVLTHARAHADVDVHGRDARARLLHEARLAARVHGSVPVSLPLDLFAVAGDLVSVQERMAGVPLRQWVRQHTGAGAGLPAELALTMARRLRLLLASVHEAGLVLRDLNPDRLLVSPGGEPMLRDLAGATDRGSVLLHRGTPGYTAPESGTRRLPLPAAPAEDLYSLGGLLFHLATGNDPVLAADAPAQRPVRERLANWLALVSRYNDAARVLRPAIMALLCPQPSERGDLAQLDRLLADRLPGGERGSRDRVLPRGQALPPAEELLADGLDHLTAAMCPDEETLWPPGPHGARTDSASIQHGAAGVLAVLLRAHSQDATDDIAPLAVEAAARKAASWLSARCTPADTQPPGLLHGPAGVAWVLTDASAVLGEPHLHAQAEHIALTLPTSWPDPGLADGLAGAALLQLRLARLTGQRRWRRPGTHPAGRMRQDGDSRFCDRAATYAAALRDTAVPGPGGPTWPVGPGTPPNANGAPTSHTPSGRLGLTHGIAGIGYALLAVGTALGDSSYVTLAGEAGYTLCRSARMDDDGSAWWCEDLDGTTSDRPHRCDGPAGIGTFLLRLAMVTGEQRFGEYARAAAGAVHRARWTSRPGTCHGLAGDGEFLLDAADFLADGTYRVWAEDMVPLLAVRHCRREGRVLLPDDSLRDVSAGYGGGLAGTLAFLLRLRHGGSRLFLVDELLTEDTAPPPDLNRCGWPGYLGGVPTIYPT
ncbi:protein kinase/lanthionine synthetase C family protein [Actinopolymorpha sp. B11F2]|uniref:protein kinase/lanthionine synthetase C family protein n=1 Tax=Actinopolymorpha sp. B11F2 TaxID=3160862 RepID=UPI0032E48C9B